MTKPGLRGPTWADFNDDINDDVDTQAYTGTRTKHDDRRRCSCYAARPGPVDHQHAARRGAFAVDVVLVDALRGRDDVPTGERR